MIRNALFTSLLLMLLIGCQSESSTSTANTETEPQAQATPEPLPYAIAIHGGAGTILPENMTAEQEVEYREALNQALDIGEAVLKAGGSSMDAVEQTIVFLEDSPLFNAGKGAVFTNEGKNELDASFMVGNSRNAGAVGGVTIVKNPIRAARAVLEHSKHVLLTGVGAETFATQQELEIVDPEYFYTESRWESLQRAKAAESTKTGSLMPADYKFGTVGCVALDNEGNITAGTSTGGMTNKRFNRFGDVPVIGAGTYASNESAGVSCTGHGEYFIRYAVAHDVTALMEYKGLSLEQATHHVIHEKLKEAGGGGGLISVDRYGNVSMPFNTPGMYRGYATPEGREVGIFGEEEK
jgi:beta-aspartyl-peptidase (threonine type)